MEKALTHWNSSHMECKPVERTIVRSHFLSSTPLNEDGSTRLVSKTAMPHNVLILLTIDAGS